MMIIAAALSLASGIGGYFFGVHHEGNAKEVEFQQERNRWSEERRALNDAHRKAEQISDGERETLQNYANYLGLLYGKKIAEANQYRRALQTRRRAHEKELPADDRACDLPAGLFDDWKSANRSSGHGSGEKGRSDGGVDAAMPRPASTGLAVPPGPAPQP